MRENAITMESPASGDRLRWYGRAKDVDVMLRNDLSYISDIAGLGCLCACAAACRVDWGSRQVHVCLTAEGLPCLYGMLSVERDPASGHFDLVIRQMLQIPIIGVNDAPQVSGAGMCFSSTCVRFVGTAAFGSKMLGPAGPVDWSIKAGTVS